MSTFFSFFDDPHEWIDEHELHTKPIAVEQRKTIENTRSPSQDNSPPGFFGGLMSDVSNVIDGFFEPRPPEPPAFDKLVYFGRPLEESYNKALTQFQIHPVLLCIQYLEKHLEEEGIFRIPGSNHIIQTWKISLDRGEEVDFTNCQNPHDVASFLKTYLRELPDGLISVNYYEESVQYGLDTSTKGTVEMAPIVQIMNRLPDSNKLVLCKLLNLLNKINSNSGLNKMNSANLAVCLATNIFREPTNETNFSAILEKTSALQITFGIMINCRSLWQETSWSN